MISLRHITGKQEANGCIDAIEADNEVPLEKESQNHSNSERYYLVKADSTDSKQVTGRIINLMHIKQKTSSEVDCESSSEESIVIDCDGEENESSPHLIRIRPNSDFFQRFIGGIERRNKSLSSVTDKKSYDHINSNVKCPCKNNATNIHQ